MSTTTIFLPGVGVRGRGSARDGGSSRALRSRSLAIVASLALTACAATQDASAVQADTPGFLLGLWQGFIFPIAWMVSLFVHSVAIYAVPNNGGWYDFGYFLGGVVLGVGARKSRVVYKDRVIDVRAKPVEEVGP